MMHKRIVLSFLLLLGSAAMAVAQTISITGKVVDENSGEPVEFASILMKENGLWAITDAKGVFRIKNVPRGKTEMTIQCLGYAKRTISMTITKDIPYIRILLKQENLKLDEVTITAKRKTDDATTSYAIDRTALDQQQIVNIGDVATLLPGGKTINPSLINDTRLALRSEETQEKGNNTFGTAIEVDGIRLDNNAAMDETTGASTRNISASNIESVEIVTGIPSVEYGDLSNGVVKVNTRKGKSPFIVEGKINQHTRQLSLNKGFDLGGQRGILNVSLEHARSFSDAASPHTAYQRNILSLNYMHIFMREGMPLTLNAGLTGNLGGYNSETDPDNTLETYTKVRDNRLQGHIQLEWLLNKSWITNLQLKASLSWQDKLREDHKQASSASAQPYRHTQEEGYFMAEDYDVNPSANIILGPTGYWYYREYNDQKPVNWSVKLKYDWVRRFGTVLSKLMVGADYSGSKNQGRGTYYGNPSQFMPWIESMRYAPTWRPYRYDELPWLRNLALYAEERITISTPRNGSLQLTAGLRDDITLISGSDYGTVSSISPRFNTKYTLWSRQKRIIRELSIHAGWGKSVKLPSFQVLYPSPSYTDILAFTPGSTADNRAYYAYYTYPSKAIRNNKLRWQYSNQLDVGVEANILGTRISLSGFYHKTYHPYMAVNLYTPFEYKTTSQEAVEASGIAAANRQYSIDPQSGIVTLSDRSGVVSPMQLPYTARHTYNSNRQYTNGSPVERYGLEWIVDFARIKALSTSIRIDGSYYFYKGLDETLFAANPAGIGEMTNPSYPLLGYYRGTSSTSTGTVASATLGNGSLSRQMNMNATITTHIPKIRMIVSLRLEMSLYNYQQTLNEISNGVRGYALNDVSDYVGVPHDRSMRDTYVAIYPEYYSTWDKPSELIPFAEKLLWAKDNDPALYNQLTRLVVKSSYPYSYNPNRLSRYYSANLSVTKEIGDHVSVSFYANNFFNNMETVHSSQTGLETSLFSSGYIPSYYYGLALKLKL